MDNSFLVVGIERRKSSGSGKLYKVLHLSQSFSDPKYGEGARVSTEYCPGDVCPDNVRVGNTVTLLYNRGYDGKAYVDGVRIEGPIPTVK